MNLNIGTPSLPVTDTWIEVHFQGPQSRRHEVYQQMRKLGFGVRNLFRCRRNEFRTPKPLYHHLYNITEFIPWQEAFAEYTDEEIVEITLKETRLANLTQRQLSHLTGIPQRQLSEIERGKRQCH